MNKNIPVIEWKDFGYNEERPPYIVWWNKSEVVGDVVYHCYKGEYNTPEYPNGEIVAVSNISVDDLVQRLIELGGVYGK